MQSLSNTELKHFASLLAERKQRLLAEWRRVLARDCGRPITHSRV